MFKSFTPEQFATKKHNNYKYHSFRKGVMDELCATCGYTYGMHYGDTCPTKEQVEDNWPNFIPVPIKKTRKKSKRELLIDRFWKFLLEEDVFFEYRENIKKNKRSYGKLFNSSPYSWITGAFLWCHTNERLDVWIDVSNKWEEILSKIEDK